MVKRYMVYMAQEKPGQPEKPCVVVSPDELNLTLPYVTIAPITSKLKSCPYRVTLSLKEKDGQIALDHLQTIPKACLAQKIGILPLESHQEISEILKQMFEL